MTEARRTLGPVVLLGLLAAGALAMAGTQPWFAFDTDDPTYTCQAPCAGYSFDINPGTVSSANALALVALACWGVLLVTRGRVRRMVSASGLIAAVGGLVTVVVSFAQVPHHLRDIYEQIGDDVPDVGSTGWYWIGAVASVLSVLAWVAAVRFVRHWPEMGHRYDTPASDAPEDLWNAMDHGHDPTS